MGAVDVPSGAAEAIEDQPQATSNAEVGLVNKPSRPGSSNKGILVGASIGILCLAALLIGILPDWKDSKKADDDGSITAVTSSMFQSSRGPFNVSIPLFSSDITKGYKNVDEAKMDFGEMAKFILNGGITDNINLGIQEAPNTTTTIDEETLDSAFSGNTNNNGGSAPPAKLVGDMATDFGTNNQESTVDISDIAKSNGAFLFTAYGKYLLVLDVATGAILAKVEMAPIKYTNPEGCDDPIAHPYPYEAGVNETTASSSSASDGVNETTGSLASDSMSMPINPCFYHPTPYIQGLSLEGDRLTVIVSGYGQEYTQNLDVVPTLWDYLGTRILVYDINGGDLKLLSTKDVNGSFLNAFTINGFTHVVTQAGVNTWDTLLQPIQRWQPKFVGMSDTEYLAEATRMAEEELIPQFMDRLAADIQVTGVDLSLVRLSLFSNSISGNNGFETSLWGGGYANGLTHVISFDMNEPQVAGAELSTSIAAIFMPSSWGSVYSNEEMLFVAGQGWDWIADAQASGQTTYLVGFELDGATSSAKVTGSVPGYVLNPYSLDFHNGYLRIATTQSFFTMVMFDDIVTIAEEPAPEQTATTEATSTTRQSNVGGVEEKIAVTEAVDDQGSTTENRIIVFKVPTTTTTTTSNVLQQVGSVQLGKKNEMFTAVRFFDKIAYAVTFEQTDPFYVLDFTNEENPVVLGELEILGFSSYLHSINSDNTKLLAVGRQAGADGTVQGLKISLFDATIPTKPQLIDEYIQEQPENSYSSSAVEWDQEAFRYLNLGDYGRLIIPMSIYVWTPPEEWVVDPTINSTNTSTTTTTTSNMATDQAINMGGNFEGFAVFSVENDKISFQFNLNHTDQTVAFTGGCWSCGYMEARSFVFNGDVVTMKQHSFLRTDLDTGIEVWNTNVDTAGGTFECCY